MQAAAKAGETPVPEGPDTKRWHVVYPTYIDKEKTIQQGRRIGKELAVENPSATEIAECLKKMGIESVVENKAYPGDWLNCRQRVRVNLPHDAPSAEGQRHNVHWLLRQVAPAVAALPSRQKKASKPSSAAAPTPQTEETTESSGRRRRRR
ncbi:putative signal recognition particle subunit SRP19 [Paratrimastix pyriformis]|uniref:Signal recognition particle subunit SRP19 n=1 Tax=Paratrimastix pyriformis TaxID=342808 RepID=A0ABQ8UUX8_9EUKA|nr:putative signal recognition particle subunit SRP19 [Paratrimastix pyriformis]